MKVVLDAKVIVAAFAGIPILSPRAFSRALHREP